MQVGTFSLFTRIVDDLHVRDRLIRQMRDEGASLRTIGAYAGLSAAGVAKILAK